MAVAISLTTMRASLIATDGFIWPAARQLGIGRVTLYRRMRALGLCEMARKLRQSTGWRFGTRRRLDPSAQLKRLLAIDLSTLPLVERRRTRWRIWYWRQRSGKCS